MLFAQSPYSVRYNNSNTVFAPYEQYTCIFDNLTAIFIGILPASLVGIISLFSE